MKTVILLCTMTLLLCFGSAQAGYWHSHKHHAHQTHSDVTHHQYCGHAVIPGIYKEPRFIWGR